MRSLIVDKTHIFENRNSNHETESYEVAVQPLDPDNKEFIEQLFDFFKEGNRPIEFGQHTFNENDDIVKRFIQNTTIDMDKICMICDLNHFGMRIKLSGPFAQAFKDLLFSNQPVIIAAKTLTYSDENDKIFALHVIPYDLLKYEIPKETLMKYTPGFNPDENRHSSQAVL